MAVIEGTFCTFDTAACEEKADYAQELVEYGDKKIPIVLETLGFDRGENKVKLHFGGENQHGYIGNWTVRIARNIPPKDWGTVIHETVHIAQEPGGPAFYMTNPKYRLLYEGVADYYRVVLSDDRKGDHHNDSKKVMPLAFS